jgi:ABC-type dipeptide/oligopeptide/nickel transport system ATPase component/ABC-type dipeptide/oligopeptide/nickel transport system permease subunit
MTEALPALDGAEPPDTRRTVPAWRRLMRRPLVVAASAVVLVIVVLVVAGPWLTPYDPARASITDRLQPPSWKHPFGTDSNGRDQLSRIMAGARLSVLSGFVSVAIAMVIGVITGLIAGYRGGRFDTVSAWIVGLFMALPGVIVLAAARSAFGPSLWMMLLLFGIFLAPVYYRLVYGAVRSVRNELYVDAARVAGLSDTRIVGRHVLSAVRAPIIIQTSMLAGLSVTFLAGVEFLGLGDPSRPTWGTLLAAGYQQIYTAPWLVNTPAIVLSITGLAFVLLGNGLRDELTGSGPAPRTPRGHRRAPSPSGPDPVANTDTHLDTVASAAPTTDALVSIHDLRVVFDQADGSSVDVIRGASLEVRRSEIHGLIGESGSGKTLTVLAVLGLLPTGARVSHGWITFDGQRLEPGIEKAYARLRGRRIGYIPQEPMTNLDPSFTVGAQLTYPLRRVLALSKRDARGRALGLLERVGIPDPERTYDSYPFELSGGMAQRVLIAGAVSMEPELLIADEPTTALDVTVQAEVLDLLRDLQDERNMAMLLVTHNVGVVADLCDRVTVMHDGAFVETGPMRDVLRSPQGPYTQMLFDALLDGAPPRGKRTLEART